MRRLLRWLGVSDANMEQGSLRCDANISLVSAGDQTPGSRVEIKNLNTARGVERALVWEQSRQQTLLEQGKTIASETRNWDAANGITTPMRAKESSAEYRFLDEPDLPPISLTADVIGLASRGLPELPTLRARRLVRNSGLEEDQAGYLTSDRTLADLYERTAGLVDDFPEVARWFCGPLAALSRQRPEAEIAPVRLAQLIRMQAAGKVTSAQAQVLLNLMVDDPRGAHEIAMEQNLTISEDGGEILSAVTALMAESPEQVQAYRNGKTALIGWFIGQVSSRLQGRADPKLIRSTLEAALELSE
jgi:aspartyl-tRNA(Asn)/glutamyl-tRNA(Gln) amidotransferase subunit B